MRRELIDLVEGMIKITQFDRNPRIKRMNKLEGITEVVFNLDELDNTNNLENRLPSNTLFTYHVTAQEDSMHFEPYTPQYKKFNPQRTNVVFLMLETKEGQKTPPVSPKWRKVGR